MCTGVWIEPRHISTVLQSWSDSSVIWNLLLSYKNMFDIVKAQKSTQAVFIQLTHEGDLFISRPAFPSRHRSWFFHSVYRLLSCCCLCFFPCAGCLFKDWVWHSHGIWCLCDCIKRMCGLRQQWTGTNPAAALHWTAPRFPPTSADLGKCLQCGLKTRHPSHMLRVICPPHPLMIMSREV